MSILKWKKSQILLHVVLQSFCAEFDASLASVHNTWEYNFLQRMVKTGDHTFAWIGGYFFQVCSLFSLLFLVFNIFKKQP